MTCPPGRTGQDGSDLSNTFPVGKLSQHAAGVVAPTCIAFRWRLLSFDILLDNALFCMTTCNALTPNSGPHFSTEVDSIVLEFQEVESMQACEKGMLVNYRALCK